MTSGGAVREHRRWRRAAGALSPPTASSRPAQTDAHLGRVLAAYGGVFVVGSLVWGLLLDGFRPTRWDVVGAMECLVGVGVIAPAPKH